MNDRSDIYILVVVIFFKYTFGMSEFEFSRLKKNNSEEETKKQKQEEQELEQKVDEICKRHEKGDTFDFSFEKSGNAFRIILDGVKVGAFSIRNNESSKQISFIMLNKNLRGKGFGKQLYKKLNEYFKEADESVLMTDMHKTSEAADNLWKSLVKEGLAEETQIKTADGHKIYRFKR